MSESLAQLETVKKPRTRTTKAAVAEVEVTAVEPRATSAKIGDTQGKAVVTDATALVFGFSTEANVKDALMPVNKHHLSGKGKGKGIAFVKAGAVVVAVAQGEVPKAKWTCTGAEADITPVGDEAAQGKIGDGRRRVRAHAATMSDFPVVAAADLSSGNAAINQKELSGKKKGAMVVNATTGFIYVAAGSAPTAKWICMDSTSADITPTAATPIAQGTLGDKPKARKGVQVAALVAPVVAKTAVEGKSSLLNTMIHSGKRLGSVVVAEIVAGTPVVLVAVGSTNTAAWTNLKTGANVTPA